VLQPVLVRALPEPIAGVRYELVAGERRLRAAKKAGLASIPAVVRTIDDQASVEQAVVENLHREDLNPLEEAAAYQQLLDEFSLTHEQVAQRVGKSRAAISNSLRLFQLPPAVQKLVRDQALTAGHARTLLGLPEAHAMERMAEQIVAEGWSVRAAEDAVRAATNSGAPVGGADRDGSPGPGLTFGTKRLREPGLLEVESLLSELLDTRVTIDVGSKRGKVAIEFADLADLERIYRIISTSPELESDD
jgi:ParB family chromosome partitioning protein